MRPTSVSTTSTAGSTAWVPLSHYCDDFRLRYVVAKDGSGDRTFSVQGTIDDALNGETVTVFDLVSSQSADQIDGSETVPLTGIRLTTTAGSGAATMSLKVLQAGF